MIQDASAKNNKSRKLQKSTQWWETQKSFWQIAS